MRCQQWLSIARHSRSRNCLCKAHARQGKKIAFRRWGSQYFCDVCAVHHILWRKVFPLWNEFKAQRELGAWLTIKQGKTRLKWQLACGEEPSLLSRSGIRPLTGTAVDKTEQNLVPTAFILQRINSNNSGRTRRNNRRCNRQSVKTNLLINYMIFTAIEDKRIQ